MSTSVQTPAPPIVAFRDVIVPWNLHTVVHGVGGQSLALRIRDTNITTIDVWIGGVRRSYTKQKGITGSGTDETLVYTNGKTRLYYVWEISGKLNHCILRIR